MRQIDNMTPQEIETLHLKGMLADNKAQPQHSPLPWKIHSCTDFAIRIDAPDRTEAAYVPTGLMNCDGDDTDNANAKLIVRAVNHADKLAEELKAVMWKVDAFGSGWKPTQAEREHISATLAAYEASL